MENGKNYKLFTELEAWQAARQYKIAILELVKQFPPIEKYRLGDQLIRASRSIASNIAEGYGRFTYKDQIHFCIQARGSLYETMNHLIDAHDCGYISEELLEEYKGKAMEAGKILNGYISWLRKMITAKPQTT